MNSNTNSGISVLYSSKNRVDVMCSDIKRSLVILGSKNSKLQSNMSSWILFLY